MTVVWFAIYKIVQVFDWSIQLVFVLLGGLTANLVVQFRATILRKQVSLDVLVHKRIFERHPGCFTREEIAFAWMNYDFAAIRVPGEREMRIATLPDGRQIEMVGALLAGGNWLVYHAMTPPSKKTWLEVDRARRRLV